MVENAALAEVERSGPGLRTILHSHEVVSREALFRRKDADAVQEQAWLFRILRSINWLVLAVAVLSGLILAKSAFTPLAERLGWGGALGTATTILAGAVAVITVATTALGQFARDGDRLGRWRKLRAEAELARCERFKAVARAAAAQGPAAAREALGLMQRELLAGQREWYEKRAARHRASARVTGAWTAAAVLLGAAASAAAVTVVFNVSSEWVLIIGVLAAAFGSFAADREGLYRDRTTAELYELTAEKLAALAAGADQVLAEIDKGNAGAVVVFTDMVVEELAAEHRQWAAGLDVTGELLARLDQRLQQARAARPPAAGAAAAAARDAARESAAGVAEAAREGIARVVTAAATGAGGAALADAARTGLAGLAGAATSAAGVTGALGSASEAAAALERWKPVLAAAAAALPPPHGDRARALLEEATAIAAPLAAAGGDGAAAAGNAAVAAASAVVERLRADNPVGQWIAGAAPKLAGVLGTAMPPLGLVLGIAGIGAQLGEQAYRRWVTRVLDTPFSPRQLQIEAVDSTAVLAAMEVSPGFAAAFAEERRQGDLAALSALGRLLPDRPEEIWTRFQDRFGGDRARFEEALREMRAALLGAASDTDLAALPPQALPGGATPQAVLAAAARLRESAGGAEGLQETVQLVHELRAAGVKDPASALGSLATAGKDP